MLLLLLLWWTLVWVTPLHLGQLGLLSLLRAAQEGQNIARNRQARKYTLVSILVVQMGQRARRRLSRQHHCGMHRWLTKPQSPGTADLYGHMHTHTLTLATKRSFRASLSDCESRLPFEYVAYQLIALLFLLKGCIAVISAVLPEACCLCYNCVTFCDTLTNLASIPALALSRCVCTGALHQQFAFPRSHVASGPAFV